jgi:hypothetical protein
METDFSKSLVSSNTNKDLLQKYAFASKFLFFFLYVKFKSK